MWAESENAASVNSPAPGGLLKLHQDKQCSSVVFQEVRWAKRKHRARNTQQEDGKNGGWVGRVHSMEKTQHSFTQGLDKNVTLGGRGAGSTDYVTFWLSDSLSERSHRKEASRTHRRERNRLWWQAPKLSQNVLFLKSTLHRLTVSPQNT